jgi:1-aminocyclopropane-1-carboxylate deaminase/D-cysteine desulfhydrase-like pyridoxal-dependent ACC family enzyme
MTARTDDGTRDLPLFRRFPELHGRVPRVILGELPTPLDCWAGEELGLDCDRLLVKRDDVTGVPYGGNKVRKLEFLLADALARDARGVVTFGVAGSNHALATSIYAAACGLQSYSMLTHQSNAAYVRRNLLAGLHAGARLMPFDSEEAAAAAARDLVSRAREDGERIVTIRGGGSEPLGCLGFVNAGLELAAQIDRESLPVPDLVYLPLGTVGTAAGLLAGLRIAGLATRMVAVRVVREDIARPERFRTLTGGTLELLGNPESADREELPDIRHEFIGRGYARFTPEGIAAMARARETLGIRLDGTYSGKAFAALLADAGSGRLSGRTVLFWDTYSSRPFAPEAMALDYRDLPEPFHYYFEQPLQPLDPEA